MIGGGERDWLHGCQRILVQVWLIVKEKGCLAGLPIIGVKGHRTIMSGERDNPCAVSIIAAGNREISPADLAYRIEIQLNRLVQYDPFDAIPVEGHCLNSIVIRVYQDIANIRLCIFRDDARLTGRKVHFDKTTCIAIACIDEIHRLSILGERYWEAVLRVVRIPGENCTPIGLFIIAQEQGSAALMSHRQVSANLKVG